MMQTYASYSAFQARAILCALQAHDRGLLQQELKRVDDVFQPNDPAESERMELLAGIAKGLETESEPFGSNQASLYRNLLQHLASAPVEQAVATAATSWASGSRSVPGAALLQ